MSSFIKQSAVQKMRPDSQQKVASFSFEEMKIVQQGRYMTAITSGAVAGIIGFGFVYGMLFYLVCTLFCGIIYKFKGSKQGFIVMDGMSNFQSSLQLTSFFQIFSDLYKYHRFCDAKLNNLAM